METFDNSILVVGNGESRRGVDLTKFSGFIVGCNALHRDFIPNYLVCCDRRMVDEAVQNFNTSNCKIFVRTFWYHYFRKIRKNKNILCLPELPYCDKNKFDHPDHWGSGPYAVLLAAQSEFQNIYLLGFDLYSQNSKVNNIYKNTKNYSNDDSNPVDHSFWVNQISRVFHLYKDKKFVILNRETWQLPALWNKHNVEYRNISSVFT